MSFTERVKVLVDVVADGANQQLGKLRGNLNDAETSGGKFKAGMSGAFETVKANAAGLAAGAGTALVAFGAKAVMSFQDAALAAGAFADSSGVSLDASSRWLEVTKRYGVELGDLQDVFNNVAGKVDEGSEVFKKLGIEVAKGADGNVDMNETMTRIIESLGKIPDPAKRAALAAELFGEEGSRQFASLVASGDKFRATLDSVADGKIIDEAEVERARELKVRIDELRARLESFMLLVGEHLVPALAAGAEKLGQVADVAGDTAEVVDDVADAINGVLGKLGLFGDAIKKAGTYAIPVYGQYKALADGIGFLGDKLGIGGDQAGFFTGKLEEQTPAIEAAAGALAAKIAATGEDAEVTEEATKAQDRHNESLEDAYKALDKVREAHERETTARRAAIDATFAARQAEADLAEQIWNSTTILNTSTASTQAKQLAADKAVQSAAELADAEVRIAQETATANGYTLSGKAAQEAWALSMLESASKMDGPLRQSVIDYIAQVTGIPAHKVTDVFANVDANSVAEVDSILEELRRDRIARIQVKFAGGTLNNDGSISFGGPGGSTETARAGGGRTTAGELTKMNESGGELAIHPDGTMIVPADLSRRLLARGNGGTTYINVPQGYRPADIARLDRHYRRRNGL
jgi:hypothetical protein